MANLLALLPNRISKTIPPENLIRIEELANLLVAELGTLTQIPEAEYKKLAKLGEKNIILYDLIKKVMVKYPEYIETDLPLVENTKDRTYFRDLEKAKTIIKEVFLDVIEHEQGIVGAEYRNGVAVFEDNVAIRVARNDAKAKLVQDEIESAYKEYDRLISTMQDSATSKKAKAPLVSV